MARHPLFTLFRSTLLKADWLEKQRSRREFLGDSLRLSAGVGALSLLRGFPQVLAGEARLSASDSVAILGGGVAGLTAAYRLATAGVRCDVYEASARLGGRMFTYDRFNPEAMFCELGGELVDSGHAELISLAGKLGVPLEKFEESRKPEDGSLFYFQGRSLQEASLIPAFRPLAARLAKDQRTLYPNPSDTRITYRHHSPGAAKFDAISLASYLHSARNEVDAWVLELVRQAYVGEYGLEADEQSSINLLCMLNADTTQGFQIFGSSDEAMRIRGGSSRLVEALQKAALATGNARFHPEHRLLRIADRAGRLQLSFDGKAETHATQVICTIPFSILRGIEGVAGLGLSPAKTRAIREFGYGTNAKYMIGFRERLWRKPGPGALASSGQLFTDGPPQAYWDTSRLQAGKSGILTNFSGGEFGRALSHSQLGGILADLERPYPGLRELHDGNAIFFRWATHPFTQGSYGCPKVGQYTTLLGALGTPELGGRLLFAGEHTSEVSQGYMNGAVESGNKASGLAISQRRVNENSKARGPAALRSKPQRSR